MGGLVGLEATHIGDQVYNAARLSGLSPVALRKMLVEMVDRESQKTVVRTEEQLLTALDDSTGDHGSTVRQAGGDGAPSDTLATREPSQSAPLRTALEVLAGQEVTRQRLEAHSPDAVWQLDHDYLANGVIELGKRENRWRYVLEDKARRFHEAGTWAARFKALQSPWEQIRIAFQAAGRKLRYAPHQRFAAYSAVRLVVNPWLPLIIALVMAGNWWWTLEQARSLFSSIRGGGSIQATEAQALWDMTQASPPVQRAVIGTALALEGNAARFGASVSSPFGSFRLDNSFDRRSSYVLHATVGMDQRQRLALLSEQIAGACSEPDLHNAEQSGPAP